VSPGPSVSNLAADRRPGYKRPPLLRLFVYGSLKRGFNNYYRFCRGVQSVEMTCTPGKLYLLPTGYPVLALPASRLLARGSSDPLADLETQQRIDRTIVAAGSLAPGWSRVRGELLTFADPLDRLRAIDALEEFRPGRKGRYERVLVRVYSRLKQGEVLAWTYVAGPLAAGRRIILTCKW
jgi:gamma-glutamylcyclotransferase (GGCT)/AIG2-like uncharacterized protein YtfP